MSTLRELVLAARAGIENLTPYEVVEELDERDALLVDVRELAETGDGVIPTAVLAPRGVLEREADPTSRHHRPCFRTDRRVITYSASGCRSALAAAALQRLGYRDVAHLDGGLGRWRAEGLEVERPAADPRVEVSVSVDHLPLLRVRLDDHWVGDLVPATEAEREALLGALTAGRVRTVARPAALLDCSVAGGVVHTSAHR